MDFIVLSIVSRVLNCRYNLARILLSTTMGAVWSVVAVLLNEAPKVIIDICTYFIIPMIMIGICEGKNIISDFKKMLEKIAVLYFVTITLSGMLHLMCYCTLFNGFLDRVILGDEQLIIFTILSVIIITFLIKIEKIRHQKNDYLRKVVLQIGDDSFSLIGYVDTGNTLVDPYSGKPVTVIDREIVESIFDNINDYSRIKYHLIPYRTVGCESGMIEVITADIMCIYERNSVKMYKKSAIGLSKVKVSGDKRYQALINGGL